jgi:cyclopropane fatty-acyl-phospholipid synthase-like methyltransferase
LDDAGERPALLDLGCGAGLLLDYLAATGNIDRVRYHGIDLSKAMTDLAMTRWPTHEFSCRDIIAQAKKTSGWR